MQVCVRAKDCCNVKCQRLMFLFLLNSPNITHLTFKRCNIFSLRVVSLMIFHRELNRIWDRLLETNLFLSFSPQPSRFVWSKVSSQQIVEAQNSPPPPGPSRPYRSASSEKEAR